jgi:hypothetical protein
MKTNQNTAVVSYKITEKTNPYLAQRRGFKAHTTERVLESNLSLEKAKEKLVEFFKSDYNFAVKCENFEEYFEEYFRGVIENHIYHSDIKLSYEEYLKTTKKRWLFLEEKNRDQFIKFNGAGYYVDGALMLEDRDMSYEYDGSYFGIIEEEIEEEIL